ncbi:MAG: T9SS type A sorting domain-containing protein [candidate division KSB1 bacterium]|nr:T9SS type A sorting domain-containing protein [candidate division KSB1 bacterium]
MVVFRNQPVVIRQSAFPLHWRLDPGALGSYSNAQIAEIVAESFNAWQNIPGATPAFTRDADFPGDITISNYTAYWGKYNDGIYPIVLDSDGQIVDAIRGVGARNQVIGLATVSYYESGINAGFYAESDVLINGFLSDKKSLKEYLGVVKHELGHLLGLDHAQIGKYEWADGISTNDDLVPLMFPYATSNSDFAADDIWAISNLYPAPGFLNGRGTLRGSIKRRDGSLVRGANVIAINTANPAERFGTVTDYSGNAPGVYEFKGLPPGNYFVLTEPILEKFFGGSSVGPYAQNRGALAFVNPVVFEYYNAANESHDHLADQPDDRVPVVVTANQIIENVNFLANDPPSQILDHYFVDSAAAYIRLPNNALNAVAVRFTPARSGQLLWIRLFINGGHNAIQGSGKMRFTVWRPSPTNSVFPGDAVDAVEVSLQALTRGLEIPYELWVGDRRIPVSAGQDFVVSAEIIGDGSVQVLLDDGVTRPSYRSNVRSNAGTWLLTGEAFARPHNIMMAAAIGGEAREVVPLAFALEQNYPNPFIISKVRTGLQTTIRFVLPQDSRVELEIFDLLGRQIKLLAEAELPKGYNVVFWDGRNADGQPVPAGIYFYRLRAGSFVRMKKLTLLR